MEDLVQLAGFLGSLTPRQMHLFYFLYLMARVEELLNVKSNKSLVIEQSNKIKQNTAQVLGKPISVTYLSVLRILNLHIQGLEMFINFQYVNQR